MEEKKNKLFLKNKNLLNLFIAFFIKKGKKELAKKIVYYSLSKASKKLCFGSFLLLGKFYNKLKSIIEVKTIKRRKKLFKVPFFINLKRQRYLSLKWFYTALKTNKHSIAFKEKIFAEFLQIVNSNQSKSIFLKQQNLKLAINNRSNIHYRW